MRTLRESKRREILAAAASVFAVKGFHTTLMDDVAARAGIGKGTIYRYFTDKEDLFFSILDTGMEELLSSLRLAGTARMTPDRKLRTMIGSMADSMMRNRPLMRLFPEIGQEQIKKRHARIREQYRSVVAVVEKDIAEGIKAGIFRRGDARLWARLVTIMTQAAFHHGKRINQKATVQALNDFFLRGIAANGKQNPNPARNQHTTRIYSDEAL